MPLQNRVSPLGGLIADPARGLVYGNRGCLHDDAGHIRRTYAVKRWLAPRPPPATTRRPYAVKRWLACRLEFNGRRRHPLLQPGRFTELFFLDEATALA